MEETKEAKRARRKQFAASLKALVDEMQVLRPVFYQQKAELRRANAKLRQARIHIDSFRRSITALATDGSRSGTLYAFKLRERSMKASIEKLKRLLASDKEEEPKPKRRRI